MKIRNPLLVVLLAMFVGLFQMCVSTFLPTPWSWFQPAILLIVAFTIRDRFQLAIVFALVAGFVTDAFAPGVGSGVLLRYLCIAIVLSAVARTTLTNQSLVAALALAGLARAIDWILMAMIAAIWILFRFTTEMRFPPIELTFGAFAWDAGLILTVIVFRELVARRFALASFGRRKTYG